MKYNKTNLKNSSSACLSLDVDNLWSYMKTHGDSGWETFPSYLDRFIPEMLEILDNNNLKITFFIVGQDAALKKNANALKRITKNGHEVANHSFHHEPWMASNSIEQIAQEIKKTGQYIKDISGQEPIGFRAPGFGWSPNIIDALDTENYVYDASVLPTYIGPLARKYYLLKSNFSKKEKEKRKELFGHFKNGFHPIRPFFWDLASGKKLLEIPVTTFPGIKIPIHFSYLLYLSHLSKTASNLYFKAALKLCRLSGAGLSFLLHPLDFMDKYDYPELSFFPAMSICRKNKIMIFNKVIKMLSSHFNPVTMNTYAQFLGEKRKK